MAVPVAALAKLAAAALSDEDTRRKLGWIVAAICSPLILTLALICSLLSGSAEHNNSAVLLCFNGGNIPGKTPAEYVAYIEDMRRSFTLLDDAIAAVNDMTEDSDSLDGIRVKAVFYAIFFGEDTPQPPSAPTVCGLLCDLRGTHPHRHRRGRNGNRGELHRGDSRYGHGGGLQQY